MRSGARIVPVFDAQDEKARAACGRCADEQCGGGGHLRVFSGDSDGRADDLFRAAAENDRGGVLGTTADDADDDRPRPDVLGTAADDANDADDGRP